MPESDSLLGQTVAHYRVLARIGGGGMGVVYEAEDTKLGRRVALKFTPEKPAQDPIALERFYREARAASALNHPNICTIYEINDQAGAPFIAMELMDGQSLSSLLQRGPLPLDRILDIAIQLTDALDAAHRKGIVHRDVKPGNIFLVSSGQLKVLDFGLAKVNTEAVMATVGTLTQDDPVHLTSPGTSLGTVAYMSPEQARGIDLDARTDLFSAGCVLYEMSTGRHAFSGSTTAVIFDQILNHVPLAPVRINPALPAELERIINKALEKDRDVRYQFAAEFRADLKRLKRDTDSGRSAGRENPGEPASGAAPPTPAVSAVATPLPSQAAHISTSSSVGAVARQHKLGAVVTVAAVLILLAAAAFGIYSLVSRDQPSPFQSFTIDKLTSSGGVRNFAISPDGNYVIHDLDSHGRRSLWLLNIPTSSDTQVVPPDESRYVDLEFSPDGNYIFFVRKEPDRPTYGYLYRMPVLGGSPRRIINDVDSGFSFSPDGSRVAFMRFNVPEMGKGYLLLANTDGTNEKILASGPIPGLTNPTWSSDGKEIVALVDRPGKSQIVALDTATANQRTMFSPDEFFIYQQQALRRARGFFVEFQSSREFSPTQIGFLAYPGGALSKITKDTSEYRGFSVSRDERELLAGASVGDYNLYVLPGSGGGEKEAAQLTSHQELFNVNWMDDSTLLFDHGTKVPEIDTMSASGGEMRTVVGNSSQLSFSPTACGSSLVFVSVPRTGTAHAALWRADSSGGNLHQLSEGRDDIEPVCSPDGSTVYYLSYLSPGPAIQLMRIPSAGGTPQRVATLPGYSRVDVSPDGRLLALNAFSREEHKTLLSMLDARTGDSVRLLHPHGQPNVTIRFSHDGKSLAYAVNENGVDNVWLQPIEGAPARQITSFSSERITDFQWSPDGKKLVVLRGHTDSDIVLLTDTTH